MAFGEGVALPGRLRFDRLPPDALPHGSAGRFSENWSREVGDARFLDSVVARWRGLVETAEPAAPVQAASPTPEAVSQPTPQRTPQPAPKTAMPKPPLLQKTTAQSEKPVWVSTSPKPATARPAPSPLSKRAAHAAPPQQASRFAITTPPSSQTQQPAPRPTPPPATQFTQQARAQTPLPAAPAPERQPMAMREPKILRDPQGQRERPSIAVRPPAPTMPSPPKIDTAPARPTTLSQTPRPAAKSGFGTRPALDLTRPTNKS